MILVYVFIVGLFILWRGCVSQKLKANMVDEGVKIFGVILSVVSAFILIVFFLSSLKVSVFMDVPRLEVTKLEKEIDIIEENVENKTPEIYEYLGERKSLYRQRVREYNDKVENELNIEKSKWVFVIKLDERHRTKLEYKY